MELLAELNETEGLALIVVTHDRALATTLGSVRTLIAANWKRPNKTLVLLQNPQSAIQNGPRPATMTSLAASSSPRCSTTGG